MNQTIKMIVIAVAAAVVGGGLVIGGMKLAGGSSKKTTVKTQASGNFWDTAGVENGGAEQGGVVQGNTGAGVQGSTGVGASGGTQTAPAPTQQPAPTPQTSGTSNIDAQLRTLLTSSAWCSFSYNQYSGASSKTRVAFYANGTFSSGGQAESYSSGDYGSVAGQSDSSDSGNWKVQGGRLYLSGAETGYQFVDIQASLSQNSNGSPIITAGGVEYVKCN